MGQMSFDFSNPIDYGSLQDVLRLHQIQKRVGPIVERVESERSVVTQQLRIAVILKNGKRLMTTEDELMTDATMATLVLLGATKNGTGEQPA